MEEATTRTIIGNGCEFDSRFRSLFYRERAGRVHVRLYAAGMRGIHFYPRAAQHLGQVNGEGVDCRFARVVTERVHIGNDAKKLEWAGRTLLRKLKHQALVITRGKDGMAVFERGRKTEHIPIYGSDEIADVTGAGDTVIATFTLALSAGASFSEAARLANYAGGIVVMKYGTRPVFYSELLRAVEGDKS